MSVLHMDKSRRRGSRIAPLCLMLASLGTTACYATKADVRRMQTTIVDLQARQDSLARATARQKRALQDSLHASSEVLRMLRGQITNLFDLYTWKAGGNSSFRFLDERRYMTSLAADF